MTSATGCPWKLPPDTTVPSSGKKSGLSVAELISTPTTSFAHQMACRLAPMTCGMHLREYASCTLEQCLCERAISDPLRSESMFLDTLSWPGWGLTWDILMSNALEVP